MSTLRVNKLVNQNDNGRVSFSRGVTVGAGQTIFGTYSINSTGIMTSPSLSVGSTVTCSGVVTATSFLGDGTGLTNVPGFSKGKGITFAILG